MFQRHLKLSQAKAEAHHGIQSVLTPVRSQGECYPRVLFDQDNQAKSPRQNLDRFLPENRRNQPRQSEKYPITRQECTGQRIETK